MPTNIIKIQTNFNFDDLPKLKEKYQAKPGEMEIKGDAHGNWRNILLDAQIRELTILNKEQHEQFGELYDIPYYMLTRKQIDQFEDLINAILFMPGMSYVLLGDVVADRGQCDYFMFRLITKIKTDTAKFSLGTVGIPISNHDQEFLDIYYAGLENRYSNEQYPNSYYIPYITRLTGKQGAPKSQALQQAFKTGKSEQDNSLQALGYLLNEKIISMEELTPLINNYIDCLKLIEYKLSDDKQSIALINNAPFPVCDYIWIAEDLGISNFKASTAEKLANSLDIMNAHYRELVKTKDQRVFNLSKDSPLYALIWNRWDKMSSAMRNKFTQYYYDYRTYYIHGHDGPDCVPLEKRGYIVSLDSRLGRHGIHQQAEAILLNFSGKQLTFNSVDEDEVLAEPELVNMCNAT